MFKVPGGITLTRTASITWSEGVATPSTTTVDVDPIAVWAPAGKRDTLLNAARTPDAVLSLAAAVPFQAASDGTAGDKFTYDGDTWEVQLSRKYEYANLYYAEARPVPS